jgi:AraC-like DNA-binding protein
VPRSVPPQYFSTQVSESRRFYLNLHEGPRTQITVFSGGWEHCQTDYVVDRPGFFYPNIEFVFRGRGRLTLKGREYELSPGTIFVYGKDTPHRIESSPTEMMEKYFVAFDGGAKLLNECYVFPETVMQVSRPEQIRQIFDDLIEYGLSDHTNRVRMCGLIFQYLIMKVGSLAVPHGDASPIAEETYQRCRQYIEDHYQEVSSLKEIGERCHLDAAYICRLFKRFRRQSPFQYLQTLKMNHAVELLQNTSLPIKEIGGRLGFCDAYNFSRSFKRIFGLPPEKTRCAPLNRG